MKRHKIAVLGAGSWGTAIAIHLAQSGHEVLLWGHTPQHIAKMIIEKSNNHYLPGVPFPKNLVPNSDITQCVLETEYVFIAVPSHAFGDLLKNITPPKTGLAWLTKGLDPNTHALLSDLVFKKFGEHYPVAVLSGPSFAKEVAQQLPTALTLASNNVDFQQQIHQLVHNAIIRVYSSEDIVGVQICGAVKNVLAIACGISDGLGYGANAKAALITRGLAEMSRLGLALGAKQDTFIGLAGVGDLVLTCTDNQSRNRRFGLLLGAGTSIDEAEQQIGQVVEGKHNAAQICALASDYHVDMPICEQVHLLLCGKIMANETVRNLMKRPAKAE